LTAAPIGDGITAFGYSGRDFSGWMQPGKRGDLTTLQFVGPGSPNPSKSAYKNDYSNIGPAIGFAWQVPWLGENKTTVRGGYQITYQGGSRFNALETALTFPPGRIYQGSATGSSSAPYLDLSNLSAAVLPTPLPAGTAPMTPIAITDRSQTISFFDPNYTSPSIQNLTLSVTHSLRPNVTVDVRYIGTLARKLYTSINLNSNNFLYNGLATEFDRIRQGGESPLLDQMLRGVNICVNVCSGTFGAIELFRLPPCRCARVRHSTRTSRSATGAPSRDH
jgi:hypothetical protein